MTAPCGCHAWVTHAAAQSRFAAAVMAYAMCPEPCVPAFGECLTTESDAGTRVTGSFP